MIGAGPASLTVARDLAPLGYECILFDSDRTSGGMIRSQIPRFRLPEIVIDEEVGYITGLGMELRLGERDRQPAARCWPRTTTRSSSAPARRAAASSTSRAARKRPPTSTSASTGSPASRSATSSSIGKRVIVLGGGNTAMDCCRTSRRLGGEDVKVIVRSGFEEMKASPWEKEDAMHEDIPILNFLVPKAFTHEGGRLTGVMFEKVAAEYDAKGRRRLVPTGEPDEHFECDDVLVAVGQENAFPWIERDIGLEFDEWDMPVVDPVTMGSTHPNVFFGGDAAFGPKNIIWAVAHGHEAAISIHKLCQRRGRRASGPPPGVTLVSQKMGIHEWSYDNDISNDAALPRAAARQGRGAEQRQAGGGARLRSRRSAIARRERCLNCDIETVFADAAVHRVRRLRRHLPDGLHHLHRERRRSRTCASG